jgi:hypothetical protein
MSICVVRLWELVVHVDLYRTLLIYRNEQSDGERLVYKTIRMFITANIVSPRLKLTSVYKKYQLI